MVTTLTHSPPYDFWGGGSIHTPSNDDLPIRSFSIHSQRGPKNDRLIDWTRENMWLKEPGRITDLLTMAQPYINYKENILAEDMCKNKKNGNRRHDNKHCEDIGRERNKKPWSRFLEYTLLNMSMETTLQECPNT